MTDADKLRKLADWFDHATLMDRQWRIEVSADLREIASQLEGKPASQYESLVDAVWLALEGYEHELSDTEQRAQRKFMEVGQAKAALINLFGIIKQQKTELEWHADIQGEKIKQQETRIQGLLDGSATSARHVADMYQTVKQQEAELSALKAEQLMWGHNHALDLKRIDEQEAELERLRELMLAPNVVVAYEKLLKETERLRSAIRKRGHSIDMVYCGWSTVQRPVDECKDCIWAELTKETK